MGFQRFSSVRQKELVDRLEAAEELQKEALAPFLSSIFMKFHEHKQMWLQVLAIVTEIDCLTSLAITSGQ